MGWYYEQYIIGKRRQWIGAPVPIIVLYKQSPRSTFGNGERRPVVRVGSEGIDSGTVFKFDSRGGGVWISLVDTNLLTAGRQDLYFQLDDATVLQADELLFLFNPEDYRAELLQEAEEAFLPSPGVWSHHELEQLMRSRIRRSLPDADVRITGSAEAFSRPIATAPIQWVLDALIAEMVFLSTGAGNYRNQSWRFAIDAERISIGFYGDIDHDLDRELIKYVADPRFGDLQLLNNSKHPSLFLCNVYTDGRIAYVNVNFDFNAAELLNLDTNTVDTKSNPSEPAELEPEPELLMLGDTSYTSSDLLTYGGRGYSPPKINKMAVGEALVGDGNEVAHVDVILGPRGSAAETAFANALTNNKDGFTALLAVAAPNLKTAPSTVMFNKVSIKGAKQAIQMFGPAQHAVAEAVSDSVADGTIPSAEAADIFICVGVFIHWEAADDKRIRDFNYRAVREAIGRAVAGVPMSSETVALREHLTDFLVSGSE